MENVIPNEAELTRRRSKKMLLYISIFSIVMLFAGVTSAYIVWMSDNYVVKMRLPEAFTISTVLILLSSVTIYLALKAAKANKAGAVKTYILLTLLLGLGFSVFQFVGWGDLFRRGHTVHGEFIYRIKGEYGKDYTYYYQGKPIDMVDGEYYEQSDKLHERPLGATIQGKKDVGSSFFMVITVLHFLHLIGGLVYLLVLFAGAVKERYNSGNTLRLELGNTYWHFLGALWIYLFLFLLFIH